MPTIPNTHYRMNFSTSVAGNTWISNAVCNPSVGNTIRNTVFSGVEQTTAVRRRPKPASLFLPTPLTYSYNLIGNGMTYPCTKRGFGSGIGGHSAVHFGEGLSVNAVKAYPSNASITSARNAAMNDLNRNGAQFGESLAQMSQTSKMISKRLRQIAAMAQFLKTGNWRNLSQVLKSEVPRSLKRIPASRRLADGWLEIQFGWLPLLSDIYVALDVYRNSLSSGLPVIRARNTSNGGFGPKGSSQDSINDRIMNNGTNAKVKVYAEVSNPLLATLNDLGLVNPLLLAWQLMPFSFVVDWVIPISPALASLTAGVGYKVNAVCTTKETLTLKTFTCGENSQTFRTVLREVSFGPLPLAPITLDFKANSLWHLGTAIALLRQSFGR